MYLLVYHFYNQYYLLIIYSRIKLKITVLNTKKRSIILSFNKYGHFGGKCHLSHILKK